MNDRNTPLVSCLCVTRNRASVLKRAIECFDKQSYENKELVIVYESDDPETKAFVERLNSKNIIVHEVTPSGNTTLGELRNLAVQLSNGEYFCQWDDDDWYHKDRLKLQTEYVIRSTKLAGVLGCWIIFDQVRKCAYLSYSRMWEGSILCKKSVVNDEVKYACISKGEDNMFIRKLLARKMVYPIMMPQLYIYVYHGKNTWESSHFDYIFGKCTKLPDAQGKHIERILSGELSFDDASAILSSENFLQDIDYTDIDFA